MRAVLWLVKLKTERKEVILKLIKINKYKKQGMSLAVATVLSRLWFCLRFYFFRPYNFIVPVQD